MAVRIKLARVGRKKRPSYRIVVAEKRSKMGGRVVATIGFYNPFATSAKLKIKKDQLDKWLSNGAQPTDTVRKLLKL